jgi:hypothetical protein
MCNCNKIKQKNLQNAIRLAELCFADCKEPQAVYKSVLGFNFCTLEIAQIQNFQIVKIIK